MIALALVFACGVGFLVGAQTRGPRPPRPARVHELGDLGAPALMLPAAPAARCACGCSIDDHLHGFPGPPACSSCACDRLVVVTLRPTPRSLPGAPDRQLG